VGGQNHRGRHSAEVVLWEDRLEVQHKMVAALRDRLQGVTIVPERQTLGQFLERWLEDSVRPTIRPRTYASYADLVRLHITPVLGRVRLAQLSPQHLDAFLNQKLSQGLSASTVKYLHAVLHRSLGQALKWGLVARNVAALVDPPRIRREEAQPLDPNQAKSFLTAIRGHRLEALYSVALAVGLRQGEALGILSISMGGPQLSTTSLSQG
jgi:integrase